MAQPISIPATAEPMTPPSRMTIGALTARQIAALPTQDELPYDDGEPMESDRHLMQMILLIETLRLHWAERETGYAGGNMFVYFSPEQLKNRDFRGPDFFAVCDAPKHERKSWVVWQEGRGPDVVIELLSETTAAFDKVEKKAIYQNELHVPEYFWFDPFSGEWAGFKLAGNSYQPLAPDERGRLVSQSLGLALTHWTGEYQDINATWLRFETLAGELLPTQHEVARQEREWAKQEREWAKQERERAERLADKLRELGIDPDALP